MAGPSLGRLCPFLWEDLASRRLLQHPYVSLPSDWLRAGMSDCRAWAAPPHVVLLQGRGRGRGCRGGGRERLFRECEKAACVAVTAAALCGSGGARRGVCPRRLRVSMSR